MRRNNREKPNILWIHVDEQRTDSLGCYGSEWAKTPNIDGLAGRGVLFRNCFCPSPVCVPSRSSQLAARYPQELNTTMNTSHLFPPGTLTFPEVFARAGYETMSYGKSHTPPHPTWEISEDIRHFRHYADNWGLGEGFDEKDYRVIKDWGLGKGLILGGTYPGGNDNPSRAITDKGIEFLRSRNADSPFLLRVSHIWPHTPVLPPPPFDNLYSGKDVPIRFFDESAYRGRSCRDRGFADLFEVRNFDRERYAQMWTDYMGLCAYIDSETGRLLAALEDSEFAENTIVLYSADHGRMIGEWGAIGKETFDDVVWRVPFVLSWPNHLPAGTERVDLCSLIDTARTLTGLTEISGDEPSSWRGRDLFTSEIPPGSGGITTELASAEQMVFGQIGFPNGRAAPAVSRRKGKSYEFEVVGRAMRLAVRTERYRMDVAWEKDGELLDSGSADGNLFDLKRDHLERINLYNDPAYRSVIAELRTHLSRWFSRLDQPDCLFQDAPPAAAM